MNRMQLHNARLEAAGIEAAGEAFKVAAEVLMQAVEGGTKPEEAALKAEQAGNAILDKALARHENEPSLVWRTQTGNILPTREHTLVNKYAKVQGPAYLHALGTQVHRQLVAMQVPDA